MSADRLCESCAVCTPSRTSSSLAFASVRIWIAASMTATSSGPAMSARPSSMRPLSDLGLGRRIQLPGLLLQTALPLERGTNDGVDVVELRRPAEHGTHLV